MQFANPLFLFALVTLVIPVLIHLFNFRRYKKVYFTNLRFLQEIQQESKKQSQLRQILILIARLLALTSLVLAFSQPFIPSSRLQKVIPGQRVVSIYIDNSFSMEAIATEGKLMDVAKTKAKEIAQAYSPSDLFQIVTNDFEGKHQRLISLEELMTQVDEIQTSSVTRPLSEIIMRQNDLVSGNRKSGIDAYLVSDFQKNTTSLASIKPDSLISWYLVPLKAEKKDNLYIDTLWFLSPVHQADQPVNLKVRIHNASSQALEKIPVKLSINGIQKAVGNFSVGANATTELVLPYTENSSGLQYGVVELVDYPVVYDDRFYFTYTIQPAIPVLCIQDKIPDLYLNALFSNDSSVHYNTSFLRQLDYNKMFAHSLIILNSIGELSSGLQQELSRFVSGGGNLVIFPPHDGERDDYQKFLSALNVGKIGVYDTARQRISGLNLESNLFVDVFEKNQSGKVVLPDNIDLPMIFRYYHLERGIRTGAEVLITLQNNQPFLTYSKIDKGGVYLFASPLDDSWSAFPKHTIFVPTMLKIALLSNPAYPLYYPTGKSTTIEIPADSTSDKDIWKIRKSQSAYQFIPESRKFGSSISLITHDQVSDAGFYEITKGSRTTMGLAFNYDRKESDLTCQTTTELEQQIDRMPRHDFHILKDRKTSLTREIHELKRGTPLWKLFVVLSLLFIATEIALIRFIKP